MLKEIGAEPCLIRRPAELETCDALIIPGGESTVISRGIEFIGLREAVLQFSTNRSIFGTCAGLILMAKTCHDPQVDCFGILDIEVQRNAFGRQAESFTTQVDTPFIGKGSSSNAIF